MALFKRLATEDVEAEILGDDVNIIDAITNNTAEEITSNNNENEQDLADIETANNVVDTIDEMIAKDKEAVESGEVSDEYAKMSVESFRQVLHVVGFATATLRVSHESFSTLSAMDVLKLSIEEKEEVKAGILENIKKKLKEIGERFKNTMSLIGMSFKNDLNIVREVRSKLKEASHTATSELSPASISAVTRMTYSTIPFDIPKLDDAGYIKMCDEAFTNCIPFENLATLNKNLKALVTGGYIDVKLTKPAAHSEYDKKGLERLLKEVKEDTILGYFTAKWWEWNQATGRIIVVPHIYSLVSKNQKPTFFKGATAWHKEESKLMYTAIEIKDSDVSLPKLQTLEKILARIEKSIRDEEKIIAEYHGAWRAAEAIGDYSPYFFLSSLAEYVHSGRDFYTKGFLHLVNTMLKHYKA
jgi:hypothetical protein